MEKEFVPYELAVKLKELGFDEECYLKYVAHCLWGTLSTKKVYYQNSKLLKSEVSAPLWQQAFDFMAFKCSIHGNVMTTGIDEIYMTSEYMEGHGGTKSNGKVYTDIYQCRIDLLTDMIELFEESHN